MVIEWTGVVAQDPATFAHVLQAKVLGRTLSVFVSQEAMDDFDIATIKATAEEKIRTMSGADAPLTRIDITTSDLR